MKKKDLAEIVTGEQKYPKKQKSGPVMDYSDSRLAFPKPPKRKKKK